MKEFTAHIRENGESQSVEEHCRNTAMLAEYFAKSSQASAIAYLSGLLHDWGKACQDFADYIHGRNNMSRGEIDHCFAGARYLDEYVKCQDDPLMKRTAGLIGRVILSHHSMHDWIDGAGESYFSRRIRKEERYSEIKKNLETFFSTDDLMERLTAAKIEYGSIRKKIFKISDEDNVKAAFYLGMFERYMKSVLVDADRTDTAFFQNDSVHFDKTKTALDIEMSAMSGRMKLWDDLSERVEGLSSQYKAKQDRISILRSDISERCRVFSEHEVSICRLIVPTGGGKTLSSLRFAVNYCKNHNKERIFYIAPYMSILEQNSGEFRKILGEENVLEHHTDVLSSLEGEEELQAYELHTEKWDQPVIATTLVQFLNALFSERMDCLRRFHKLANAVIIIDEVQSLPIKCTYLFNLAMNYLAKICKSCIVLCTATQPTFEQLEYPLLLDENSSMTGEYEDDFKNLSRSCLVPLLKEGGYTYDEAASFCRQKYAEHKSVLFIVNTKMAALEIFKKLKDLDDEKDRRVYHLSNNMCPNRRKLVIDKIKKGLQEHKRIICITTQLIEAGVDISFPCVIRSLAGLDRLAQAAGRCNRHGEWKKCCNVYVLNLSEEKVSLLPDISQPQNISGMIMRNRNYPDLMSISTMDAFFKKYYSERREDLAYKVDDGGIKTNLVEMLSLNRSGRLKDTKEPSKYCRQAFKTAGTLFQVIENLTVPVIVPDNDEAREIISQLAEYKSMDETKKILRKLQKYTVEVYKNQFSRLKESHAISVVEVFGCAVYVLDEEFYDPKVGIKLEGEEAKLLLY